MGRIFELLSLVLVVGLQYIIFTGLAYLIFYVWQNKYFWIAKIQQRYPKSKHVLAELGYSASSFVIFGLVIYGVWIASRSGYTREYHHVSDYGYPYLFFSFLLMVLIHDTYFYWTHRLLHWKPLFKHVHRVHHLSHNPTSFSAYSFHPVEALIEVGIVPVIAFTMPYHTWTIVVFTLYSLLINMAGHLGFELFPKGFVSHRIFKWHNTSTHHNMHHRLVKCNYGLYFNVWDRLMQTNHPHYEESFEEVVARRDTEKLSRKSGVPEKAVTETAK